MSFVHNEQVNIEIFSVPELERILTRTPDRVELIFNVKSKSEYGLLLDVCCTVSSQTHN